MPASTRPLARVVVGLTCGVVLIATAACSSGDEPASAVTDDARPSVASDEVTVLDSERGTPDEPARLEPGRYVIPFIGASDMAPWGEIVVPAGWSQDRLHPTTGTDLDPHLRRIELLAVDRVAQDPCTGVMHPVDPTIRDIVAALSRQQAVRSDPARRVSLDGHPGRMVQFEVPVGLEGCPPSLTPFGIGASWSSVFPGWTYQVWVVDVDDEPLVVLAAHGPATTPDELDELTAMVEGLRFVEGRDASA
jgi:hypothetical protein